MCPRRAANIKAFHPFDVAVVLQGAPALRSLLTEPSEPLAAAIMSADRPLASNSMGSAPASKSTFTISVKSYMVALMRAVVPSTGSAQFMNLNMASCRHRRLTSCRLAA